MSVKYTVTFPDKVNERIEEISSEEQTSKPEVLRRAIALYSFLFKEWKAGSKIIVEPETGDKKEIVFL